MPTQESPTGPQGFTCSRCRKATAPLAEAPFPTELGRKIQETICRPCWDEWFALSIRVVNEYRLDLLTPEGSQFYDRCMLEFLGVTP